MKLILPFCLIPFASFALSACGEGASIVAPTLGADDASIGAPRVGTSVEAITSGTAASFVTDVTVPDHAAVTAGATFTKTWRMRNNGTTTWTNFRACRTSGEAFGTSACVPIPTTASGATVDISVTMTAPPSPTCAARGHSAVWAIQTSAGVLVSGGTMTVVPTINPTSGTPRPDLSNRAYSTPTNPFAGLSLGGNCTGYAFGRYFELTGIALSPRGDASSWFGVMPATRRATVASNATSIRTPSVAVWPGGAHGHVAVIESVSTVNGVLMVTFTEANWSCESGGWGGGYDGSPKTLSLSAFRTRYSTLTGIIW